LHPLLVVLDDLGQIMGGLAAIVNSVDCSLVGMPLPRSGQRYTLHIYVYAAPVSQRKDLRAANTWHEVWV